MIAIDSVTLANLAQQLDARCDPQYIAQEIRALIAAAKPSADVGLVTPMYEALANMPCTCVETGSWPRFKADVKAHPERVCAKHQAIRPWEQANNLEPRP